MRSVGILFFFITVSIFAPVHASAQEVEKVHRIGFLWPGSQAGAAPSLEAFRKGLRRMGYESLEIEEKYAAGSAEHTPALVTDLITSNVEVIVTTSIPSALAAR